MRKPMTVASMRILFAFCFSVSIFVFGNIPAVIADETPTVEGVWEQVSANSPAFEVYNGKRRSITKTADGYGVSSADNTKVVTYTGASTRIVRTDLEDLV